MASSSAQLHEPDLPPDVIDRHRAIVSIMEELEAVDWYDQRVNAGGDPALAAVLAHNRDEEKEHAVMTLEWLRRRDPAMDKMLRTYLFTEGDILAIEGAEEGGDGSGPAAAGGTGAAEVVGLGIGSLRHDTEGLL